MTKPEKLYCGILQDKYNRTVTAIDSVISTPVFVLKSVISTIKKIERITTNSILFQLSALETLVNELLELTKLNSLEEKKDDFCQVAFACQALINRLFSPDEGETDLIPFIPLEERNELLTDYNKFKTKICKLSLIDMFNTFYDDLEIRIRNEIAEIRTKLLDLLNLDYLLYRYQNALNDSGILQILTTLEFFRQCAFETCSWAQTSNNKIEDYESRLYITKVNGSYVVDFSEPLQPIYDANEDIQERLDNIERLLTNRKLDDVVSVEDIMRG